MQLGRHFVADRAAVETLPAGMCAASKPSPIRLFVIDTQADQPEPAALPVRSAAQFGRRAEARKFEADPDAVSVRQSGDPVIDDEAPLLGQPSTGAHFPDQLVVQGNFGPALLKAGCKARVRKRDQAQAAAPF